MPVSEELKLMLDKQQYELIGKHSRVKVCHWTKSSLKGGGACYKHKFYGIKSHQCVQMTPSFTCNFACSFCWRDHRYHTAPAMNQGMDNPDDIVENSIDAQRHQLIGFGGNKKVPKDLLNESMQPKHVAISLDGEPTLYPKLPELIDSYREKGISSFLVSNGSRPDQIKKLLDHPPTQIYISLDAPNKKLFHDIDNPLIKDAWEKLMQTLDILKELKAKTRTAVRITLIKGKNIINPEEWADLLKKAEPLFVEIKAYMWVGYSRERLEKQNMPLFTEVKEFAKEIAKSSGYKFIDEHEPSRVVLLLKEDFKGRIMEFDKEQAFVKKELKKTILSNENNRELAIGSR